MRREGGLDVLVAAEIWVHAWGIVGQRVDMVQDRRKGLVLDLDELDGPGRDLGCLGSHRGHRLAVVANHVLGQDVLVHDVETELVVELLADEDGVHADQTLGLGRVDAEDLRARIRTALDLGVQHPGQHHVTGV